PARSAAVPIAALVALLVAVLLRGLGGAGLLGEAGQVELGLAPEERLRVGEVVGAGHEVGVVPHRVPALRAARVTEGLPEGGRLPQPPGPQLQSDQRGE